MDRAYLETSAINHVMKESIDVIDVASSLKTSGYRPANGTHEITLRFI